MRHECDATVQFDNVTVYADTDKALLCEIEGEQHWIPKSQMRGGTTLKEKDDYGTLVITKWIAGEKGLA